MKEREDKAVDISFCWSFKWISGLQAAVSAGSPGGWVKILFGSQWAISVPKVRNSPTHLNPSLRDRYARNDQVPHVLKGI
jgi:hypothetical protein